MAGLATYEKGIFYSAVLVRDGTLFLRGIRKMENTGKKCAFFGHRKINATAKLKERLTGEIERLIVQNGVSVFLFGSRSEFDDLCYQTVTVLQEKYPHIQRVAYPCKSEYAYVKGAQDKVKTAQNLQKYGFTYQEYEQVIRLERLYSAGKASYVERNQEMLNQSDFVIFYYDEEYTPKAKSASAKSGTKLIYEYALQKKTPIINIFTR